MSEKGEAAQEARVNIAEARLERAQDAIKGLNAERSILDAEMQERLVDIEGRHRDAVREKHAARRAIEEARADLEFIMPGPDGRELSVGDVPAEKEAPEKTE